MPPSPIATKLNHLMHLAATSRPINLSEIQLNFDVPPLLSTMDVNRETPAETPPPRERVTCAACGNEIDKDTICEFCEDEERELKEME